MLNLTLPRLRRLWRSPNRWPASGLAVVVNAFLLVVCAPLLCPAQDRPLTESPYDSLAPYRRILWVSRWEYSTADDIKRICTNAASVRFTDLLFQVRGEGTVFFNSPYEPWAWELSGRGPAGTGADPGWDPLAVAIRECRRRGLRIHAYVNTLPAWAQGVDPPAGSGQIYASHRDWLMVDKSGRVMKPRGFYAFVDPALPEVRRHLARLIGRLVADYPVDGVHLDYIRYPFERGDYSYQKGVVRDFNRWYGRSPEDDPRQWNEFRRRQITDTIKEIREAIRAVRPGVELSVAVIADLRKSRDLGAQDAIGWLEKNYVDAIAPMSYAESMDEFRPLARPYLDPSIRDRVWLGILAEPKNTAFMEQARAAVAARTSGVAFFSYQSIFKGHRAGRKARELYRLFTGSEQGETSVGSVHRTSTEQRHRPHKRRRRDLKVRVKP